MQKYKLKWITQRITAILLIPLSFWFIYNCLSLTSMTYNELIVFFNSFLNSFLFLVMMITTLIHSKIGNETIIDDYIKSKKLNTVFKLLVSIIVYILIIILFISIIKILLI